LTRDPAAIASLNLNSPHYTIITSDHPSLPDAGTSDIVNDLKNTDPSLLGTQFALPQTLSEKYLVLPPLHSNVYGLQGGVLVFTKSVESVGRLVRLTDEFEAVYAKGSKSKHKITVRGYTGDLKPGERKALLADFAEGNINMFATFSFTMSQC
jgi:ATP-dependent RNA helicase DDX51/DBP6